MKVFKNASVFTRWFFSYLLMLGLVLIASFGLYFFAYNIIDEQGEQVNRTMLEKVQTEIDGYIINANNVVTSLMIDSNVQKLGRIREPFELRDRALLYEIYKDITNIKLSGRNFSHLFIYFPYAGSMISDNGHVEAELFYELYYKNSNMSYDEFCYLLKQNWNGEIITLTNSKGEKEIFILRNNFLRGADDREATFVVSITYSELAEWLSSMNWDESTELLMMSTTDFLCGTGTLGSKAAEQYFEDLNVKSEAKQICVDGKEYRAVISPSTGTGLCYMALTPIEDVQEGARSIQLFMLVGLGVCLTVGVAVAYILTRNNYQPLQRTMSILGEYKRENDGSNEYQWMYEQTIRFLTENKDVKRKLYDNEKILRSQYIYRLITLPYEEKSSAEFEYIKGETLTKPCNLVVLLFCSYEDDTPWQADVDRGLFRFIITNVMEDLLCGRYGFELVELADSFAGIINGVWEKGETREELESTMEQMQEFLGERMKLHVTAVFGEPQNGLEGIYRSYLTAQEAAQYKEQTAETQMVWYDDIRDRHTLYQYPIETEQRIINAIKVGQQDNALQWLNEVIENNFRNREITTVMKKCLLSELLGTLVKGAELGGSIELMTELMDAKGIPGQLHEQKAKIYFGEMIACLCEDIRSKEETRKENGLFGKRVMEYVRNNYQNPDLNISIAALHFDITPSYLSTLFKEQTGQNLLEYINQTRVERVKELLEEGMSLTEICPLTGFRSSGALIRVFKKCTGITPGQMKKSLQ